MRPLWKYIRCVYWKYTNICGDVAICLRRKGGPLIVIDIDWFVEVKDIWPCALLTQFTEKRVFVMSCCILNFIRFFFSHAGTPVSIFKIISPNISSSDLDLDVSSGRGLLFCVDISSTILSILSATRFLAIFFSWTDIFPSTGRDIFPSLGLYIVSIWDHVKFVSVTWGGIKLSLRNNKGWKRAI